MNYRQLLYHVRTIEIRVYMKINKGFDVFCQSNELCGPELINSHATFPAECTASRITQLYTFYNTRHRMLIVPT
jgi:hypothetical protein